VPYQPFRTSDGDVILACGNDNLFRKFCDRPAASAPADPRFASNGKRVENRAEITHLLQDIFTKRKTSEWIELLDAAGVPNGPINDIAQVFADRRCKPAALHRARAPDRREIADGGKPDAILGHPLEYRLAPPLLGAHTDEILRDLLGRSAAQIAKLG